MTDGEDDCQIRIYVPDSKNATYPEWHYIL